MPTPLLIAVAIAIATALFALGLGIVLETQLRITWNAENAPIAHMKKAKYLTPMMRVDVAIACPTIPIQQAIAICQPLSSVLPECQLFAMEKKKAAKYGGDVSRRVITLGYPKVATMLGKK